MKKILILFILISLFGCRTKESLVEKEITTITRHTRDSIFTEIRDTVIKYLPAPETSTSVGRDSSRLKTSLAWSLAIWDGFKLSHTIENFPSFDLSVPHYEKIYRWRTDTIYKDKKVYIDKVVVKEKYRFLNALFYGMGIASAVAMVGYAAFKFLRK